MFNRAIYLDQFGNLRGSNNNVNYNFAINRRDEQDCFLGPDLFNAFFQARYAKIAKPNSAT